MSKAAARVAALRAFGAGKDLDRLPDDDLGTLAEIEALLFALDALLARVRAGETFSYPHGPLYLLAGQVQDIDFRHLQDTLGEIPDQAWFCVNRLADVCEAVSERLGGPTLAPDALPVPADDLSFACKVLAAFAHPRLPKFMRATATQPAYHDEYLWEVMFRSWLRSASEKPEKLLAMSDALAGMQASGFLRVTHLDYANALAHGADFYAQQGHPHPFDSEAGEAALAQLLERHEPEESSYAVSAAAALPFVAPDRQTRLLALAAAHPNPLVQLEASYVRAKNADEQGVQELAFATGDSELEARAYSYLTELGREDVLGPDWHTEDAQARRQILNWLAHPNEFGRAPDELDVQPPITLFWPPSAGEVPLRVFRYRYLQDDGVREGQGVEGSVLFALRRPTAELSSEELLALHCSWETAQQEGREDWSVEDGWQRLAEHNPQFKPRKKGFLSRLFRA